MMCLNNNLSQTLFGLRNKDQPTQPIIPKEIKQDLIEAGDVSYIDNSLGYHMIKNLNPTQTESIHIYSPPSYKANIYV